MAENGRERLSGTRNEGARVQETGVEKVGRLSAHQGVTTVVGRVEEGKRLTCHSST